MRCKQAFQIVAKRKGISGRAINDKLGDNNLGQKMSRETISVRQYTAIMNLLNYTVIIMPREDFLGSSSNEIFKRAIELTTTEEEIEITLECPTCHEPITDQDLCNSICPHCFTPIEMSLYPLEPEYEFPTEELKRGVGIHKGDRHPHKGTPRAGTGVGTGHHRGRIKGAKDKTPRKRRTFEELGKETKRQLRKVGAELSEEEIALRRLRRLENKVDKNIEKVEIEKRRKEEEDDLWLL